MIAQLKRAATRWQNRLLNVLLTEELDEINVYSYPRGAQLRKALREDPAARTSAVPVSTDKKDNT